MPGIATVVADFQNGSLVGVGAMPNNTSRGETISETCRVKYNSVPMTATISSSNRLNCAAAGSSQSSNGNYLFFEDDWSTVADMDINRPLVVSGKFSGCMWKVFREQPGGVYKCVHIARPGDAADALVKLVTNGTAVTKGWVEIQAIPTAGYVGKDGCNELFVVSQYFPAQRRIDSIALAVNSQGRVVNTVFQSDPA